MANKKVAATLRKPPSPRGLEDLEIFVDGRDAPLRTSIHELRPSAMPTASTPGGRRARRLEVALEPALVEQLSLHCLSNNRELDAVVAEAIRKHLREPAPRETAANPSSDTARTRETSRPRPAAHASEAPLLGPWQAFGFVD